jgi:hypothetical protein
VAENDGNLSSLTNLLGVLLLQLLPGQECARDKFHLHALTYGDTCEGESRSVHHYRYNLSR